MDPTLNLSQLPTQGQICLVTHPTEVDHPTNTGVLAMQVAQQCQLPMQRFEWHRLDQHSNSLQFRPAEWCLLYPTPNALRLEASLEEPSHAVLPCANVLILDATWQRAQKMFNQSPWLQQLPTLVLVTAHPSSFTRRRHQKPGAWCTAEVVQWLWQSAGQHKAAQLLARTYKHFNQRGEVNGASGLSGQER